MKTFFFNFEGREVGAIGISYRHFRSVRAETETEARLKLYDTHQDITDLKLVRVTDKSEE